MLRQLLGDDLMATQKILTVATAVQKAVLENVLLGEIASGFWKNARPADHADNWKGVEIKVGVQYGATGFEIPRNYNFVNPDFFSRAGKKMLDAALTADANITEKALKKQLILLNKILGGRILEANGPETKLPRGRKADAEGTETKTTTKASTTVKRVAANVQEPTEQSADAEQSAEA